VRTEECSIAEIRSFSLGRRSSAVWIAGVSANIFASVPPEVKTTSPGRAATSAAISSRASSTSRRAARPSACTEDGLPGTASASRNASAACGRMGAVAFQSK